MKKFFNLFLAASIVLIVFIGFTARVKAYEPNGTLYGEDVIDRIDDSEVVFRHLIDTLTNWSNSYSEDLKDIINRDLISDVSFDNIIYSLRSVGHSEAANALESIKQSMKDDIEYLKTTADMIKYYIDNDVLTDNIDDTDIYYNLRNSFRTLKEPINNLIRIYYNSYYTELENKIDSFNSYSGLESLYDDLLEALEGTAFNKFKQKLDEAKEIYINHDLEIYEPLIKEEFRSYYERFKTDYDKLYTKLENKLQQILDERLDSIINPVDRTNISEVIEANRKIYDIMNKIEEVTNEVSTKLNKINTYFSDINIFMEYASEYEDKIISRLNEAYNYTRSKLIDLDLLVTVKYEKDKKIIKIDYENGIIIYNSKDLNPSTFINKLSVNYGELRESKTYNGKIGTKSRLSVYYEENLLKFFDIIVRGDINPDAKIDITDLVVLCDKMYGLVDLDFYRKTAADFDDNDIIDITDLVYLCDKIYE